MNTYERCTVARGSNLYGTTSINVRIYFDVIRPCSINVSHIIRISIIIIIIRYSNTAVRNEQVGPMCVRLAEAQPRVDENQAATRATGVPVCCIYYIYICMYFDVCTCVFIDCVFLNFFY